MGRVIRLTDKTETQLEMCKNIINKIYEKFNLDKIDDNKTDNEIIQISLKHYTEKLSKQFNIY